MVKVDGESILGLTHSVDAAGIVPTLSSNRRTLGRIDIAALAGKHAIKRLLRSKSNEVAP